MQGVELSIMVALGAGVLSFLSPCVLPLVPSYLSFIAGVSFEDVKRSPADPRLLRKVVLNSLLFIAGFSAVFMTLGLSFSLVGQLLIQYQEAMRMGAGLLRVIAHEVVCLGARLLLCRRAVFRRFFTAPNAGVVANPWHSGSLPRAGAWDASLSHQGNSGR